MSTRWSLVSPSEAIVVEDGKCSGTRFCHACGSRICHQSPQSTSPSREGHGKRRCSTAITSTTMVDIDAYFDRIWPTLGSGSLDVILDALQPCSGVILRFSQGGNFSNVGSADTHIGHFLFLAASRVASWTVSYATVTSRTFGRESDEGPSRDRKNCRRS